MTNHEIKNPTRNAGPVKYTRIDVEGTKPKLTIGMACYDDMAGVWMTIQSLLIYQVGIDPKEIEIVVIDNNPSSSQGHKTRAYVVGECQEEARGYPITRWHSVQYVPFDEYKGTSKPRDMVFDYAQSDYVLVLDSHIMLDPLAIRSLLDYYQQHPDTCDLLSGPMFQDNAQDYSTHFNIKWRGYMLGTWGRETEDPQGNPIEPYERKAIEIRGMGLGLFSCRKDAWLGFNPAFRGFGGEEIYIHEKFRQAGYKCMCLMSLVWFHRFGMIQDQPYPNDYHMRVRNYVIGHYELGWGLEEIYHHFVASEKSVMSHDTWMELIADPINFRNVMGDKIESLQKQKRIEQEIPTRRGIDNRNRMRRVKKKSICKGTIELIKRSSLKELLSIQTANDPNKALIDAFQEIGKAYKSFNVMTDTYHILIPLLLHSKKIYRQVEPGMKNDAIPDLLNKSSTEFEVTKNARKAEATLINTSEMEKLQVLKYLSEYGKTTEKVIMVMNTIREKNVIDGIALFCKNHPDWFIENHFVLGSGLILLRKGNGTLKFIHQVKGFFKTMIEWASNSFRLTEKTEAEKRYSVCQACDLFDKKSKRCLSCGCFMEKKVHAISAKCPLDKWKPHNEEKFKRENEQRKPEAVLEK